MDSSGGNGTTGRTSDARSLPCTRLTASGSPLLSMIRRRRRCTSWRIRRIRSSGTWLFCVSVPPLPERAALSR